MNEFLKKVWETLTTRETVKELTDRMLKNPRTSKTGFVVLGLAGAAAYFYDSGFILAAGLTAGTAAFISFFTLIFARDGKPGDQ